MVNPGLLPVKPATAFHEEAAMPVPVLMPHADGPTRCR